MKRILTCLLGLALCAVPLRATITLIAHTSAAGANGATTAGINTTGANFIVVFIGSQNGKSITVTDSNTNTWPFPMVDMLLASTGTNQNPSIIWIYPTTVGAGHTFTVTATGAAISFEVAAFSGVGGLTNIGMSGGIIGSTTAPFANSLVTAGIACNTGPTTATFTINSGMTITDQQPFVGGTNYASAFAYVVQTSPSAINPAFGGMGGGTCYSRSYTFGPATGSSGGGSYIAKTNPPKSEFLWRKDELELEIV